MGTPDLGGCVGLWVGHLPFQKRDMGHSAADEVQSLSDGTQYLSDDLQSAAGGTAIGRAFSPWVFCDNGTQGDALGWYYARLWRWFVLRTNLAAHFRSEIWSTRRENKSLRV